MKRFSIKPLLLALVPLALFGGCSRATSTEHASHEPPVAATAAATSESHAGHSMSPVATGHEGHGAAPTGYAGVGIDSASLAPFGFASQKVEHRMLTRTSRTVGVVTLDETRTAHVHSKVKGFVEAVQADFVGKTVKRGEALCSVYSQSVLAAQLELVGLLKQRRTSSATQSAATAVVDRSWDTIVDAAKRRLSLWDVPKGQIDRLEETLEPVRTFTLSAPRAGVIVDKQAFVGNYVEPGTELYDISDLSHLWVELDLYAADQSVVTLDQEAALTVEGVEAPITAKVSFVAPAIDPATRTLRVRLTVDNPDGSLRPGAYVTAEMKITVGHGLVVPEEAVIRTGIRNIVYVVHEGHIQPREVKLGPLAEGIYLIPSGLVEGEEVATGAQFLIDSESRLRATSTPGGEHAGHAGH